MSTLLTSCADRLDYAPFLGRLADGLKDDADIKLLCHRMLISLAEIAGSAGAPPTASAALRESLEGLTSPRHAPRETRGLSMVRSALPARPAGAGDARARRRRRWRQRARACTAGLRPAPPRVHGAHVCLPPLRRISQ